MGNIILVLVISAIIIAAIAKIVIEKKKGAKCIGCPHAYSNNGKCNCGN